MALPPNFTATDFRDALLRLLPRGPIWRRDAGSNLFALFGALAPSWSRNAAAGAQVLLDGSPATTSNLLSEWESSLGLPDQCTAGGASVEQRQAAVRAKWGQRGSLTIPYLTTLALNLGFAITVTEYMPFEADQPCDLGCNDPSYAFVWTVNAPEIVTSYFAADQSSADDPLETFDSSELVCRIRANAPAETLVLLTFS